ncbi:uncharacterized protein LOC119354222 [Triticum dicoccoides]|uniref:uncharacterized protein LOC119354222 n=1 Tax=Triticum dicoccoides TaxID=85692 RepID=UPI00188EA077|nr:uncharacterized protein LOC119354222 [Triticum dicoccoides]
MTSSEPDPHDANRTLAWRIPHRRTSGLDRWEPRGSPPPIPAGAYLDSVCADLLDVGLPSDMGHDLLEEEKTESCVKNGDSHPCPIGRDDVCLDDMFHDIFGDWPLTGDPILWDDIRSENSDDYVVPESDECDRFADVRTNCPGRNIPRQQAKKIDNAWLRSIAEQNEKYDARCQEILRQNEDADLPPVPLDVFPEATGLCVERGSYYHIEYMTHDTSTTNSDLGYSGPELMLQIFSLRLSSFSASYSCPISVYGVFAVRDVLEPLRNHVFNRSRDDPVTVDQDPFTLPLCSPCRGMYIPYDQVLLEVDLWIKKEGDGSADQKLLSKYLELDVRTEGDGFIYGCIPGDTVSLEIDCAYLTKSVEAVIEVSAEVSRPCQVRFVAFSSGYDDEIVLFNGKFTGEKVFKHVVAVKAERELKVQLEVEESVFQWTFQGGNAGPLSSPDDSTLKYGQFDVGVCFYPSTG